jgi:hypothetical protein
LNASKTKWRFTPKSGWLVLGSLALTSLLLLSEYFQWFTFNQRKGCTVLIAVACVVVCLVLALIWWLAALAFQWRFQFSIRSLLLSVVVVAVPFSWLAVEIQQARWQRELVASVLKKDGIIWYDHQVVWWNGKPSFGVENAIAKPPPNCLRSYLGDDFFWNIAGVGMLSKQNEATDADLELLGELSQLNGLFIRGSNVTNAGLRHLLGLKQLKTLSLVGTKVTDDGLENFNGLKQLQWLAITDEGSTAVTDTGVRKLKSVLPNCSIDLRHVLP